MVDGNTASEEVMLVNSWSGTGNNTWAVTRAVEGPTASSHGNLATVENDVTAGYITNLNTWATTHAHTGLDQSTTLISPYYSAHPNGGFESWQYGTSVASPAAGAYIGPDLWQWNTIGTGVITASQSTDVPTIAQCGVNTPYSLLITPTTADTSIAAGDVYAIYTNIEGFLAAPLLNGCAASFWVKAHLTGQYSFAVWDTSGSRNFIATYTVNAADTWEYKTVIIPTTVGTGGTFDSTTGKGMWFYWSLGMGSTSSRTADGTWATGSAESATGQVNVMASTANLFRIWGFNIVPGNQPTPYIPMPYPLMMTRIRRYVNTYGDDGPQSIIAIGQAVSTTNAYFYLPFPIPMRAIPTLTTSGAGNFTILSATGTALACTALAITSGFWNSYHGISLQGTVASGLVAGSASYLYCQNSSANLRLEAYP